MLSPSAAREHAVGGRREAGTGKTKVVLRHQRGELDTLRSGHRPGIKRAGATGLLVYFFNRMIPTAFSVSRSYVGSLMPLRTLRRKYFS